KSLDFEPQPKSSMNNYNQFKTTVLQPPIESKQYVSVAYTTRLEQEGIDLSVGTVGDSYDNALAETVNGLYKTELIYQRRSWDSLADVELATMHWVYWWNNKRYHDALGLKTPAQVEAAYYANRPELVQV
ncbi:integrase core domain-containing protein, partial [Corynebacterium diphtheriae]